MFVVIGAPTLVVFVQLYSGQDLSRIELLHVALQFYMQLFKCSLCTTQRWVMKNIDPCWVKVEQEESIFAVNSLEYSMSLLFSFSPLANTLYTAKKIQCSD